MKNIKNLIIILEAALLIGGVVSWFIDEYNEKVASKSREKSIKELVFRQDSLLNNAQKQRKLLELRINQLDKKQSLTFEQDSLINLRLSEIDSLKVQTTIREEIDAIYRESEKF